MASLCTMPAMPDSQPHTLADERTAWFDAPQGRHVLAAERALMEGALADVFGFVMVQVGAWGAPGALLRARRIPQVVFAGAPAEHGTTSVVCAGDALPFDTESVDAVVLPHALECAG